MKLLNDGVSDFLKIVEAPPETNIKDKVATPWEPPPVNWLKANTDAAFKEGTVALAFVLRDSSSYVIYFETKLDIASSPFEAELRALAWALDITKDKS